jgi:deoxyhypusine synthase
MLIFGGGLVKHHICNANLMRNGANFAVFVNTGQEFDGSDSGAKPDEAVSWGKVRADAMRGDEMAWACVGAPWVPRGCRQTADVRVALLRLAHPR